MRLTWTPERIAALMARRSEKSREVAADVTARWGFPVSASQVRNIWSKESSTSRAESSTKGKPDDFEISVDHTQLDMKPPPREPPLGVAPVFERRVIQASGGKAQAFGDLHAPFWHRPGLDAALAFTEREQPDFVVQVGDGYDFFNFSRFPRSMNAIKPQDELDQGRARLEWFWAEVQRRAPKAKCYQVLGNHDTRIKARILEKCPEVAGMVFQHINDLHRFDGVTTIFDPRDDLEIDGVLYTHGDDLGGAPFRHAASYGRSTVFGHTHHAHIVYRTTRQGLLWELNVGHLADPNHEALSYPPKKVTGWTRGFGVIRNGVPFFVPLP